MRSLSVTSGVVLDPYSILVSGLTRQHCAQIDQPFEFLHGEAKFKQAFVNACYFAESMTVVGPVAQLVQSKEDHQFAASLRWRADFTVGDNRDFYDQLLRFQEKYALSNVPVESLGGMTDGYLHLMPDATLRKKDRAWTDTSDDLDFDVFSQLFNSNWGGMGRYRKVQRTSITEGIRPGTPVTALMAVIFSFKKPVGPLAVGELTNLAGWPPVVFLLPVLVPAFATIDRDRSNTFYEPWATAIFNQPAVMSYQIRIPKSSNQETQTTLPYGQPYRLKTISSWGKEPDPLRSLSDVFKALWSQAAQYSAWNLRMNWDPKGTADAIGELALDPIGAGRRIRGHNRFSNKYLLHIMSMLWETTPQGPNKVWGWDSTQTERLPTTAFSTGFNRERTKLFYEQLRSTRMNGGKEVLFVFPSYFQDQVSTDFFPQALTLARWMMVPHAGLADFVDSTVVNFACPGDGTATDEAVGNDETLAPRGEGEQSFIDRLAAHLHTPTEVQPGALPVRRMFTPIGFDKTGDPTVFGLQLTQQAIASLSNHVVEPNAQYPSMDDYTTIVDGTSIQGNFKFLDAFCSKSTKDLTDVFATVNKKAAKEMGAGRLVDDSMVVDLFDDML